MRLEGRLGAPAGPVASLAEIFPTLVASGLVSLACIAIVIGQPSVRAIRAAPMPEPLPA
jgi:hypothetical protein